jgi:serine/threonine-protein kinase
MQTVRALGHLHQNAIVHRDIKPSNFLLTHRTDPPHVKLIDLGLSRSLEEDGFRVAQVGFTVGTIDYIAPEQAEDGSAADVRSDIYSLGCTWYHLLAGQPPFQDMNLVERVRKHREEEPPDPRQFNPKVSLDLLGVLCRMLAKKPAERYQAPAELLQDLKQLNLAAATTNTVSDFQVVPCDDTLPIPVQPSVASQPCLETSPNNKKK